MLLVQVDIVPTKRSYLRLLIYRVLLLNAKCAEHLVFLSYFRAYIPYAADLTRVLSDLVAKDEPNRVLWTYELIKKKSHFSN
jgi:hypothetical protein